MRETNSHLTYRIPLAIAVIAFLVLLTGGFVRINDAGESCPDWPTCFDSWGFSLTWEQNQDQVDSRGPQHRYSTFEIFTEWFHRLLVGVVLAPVCLWNVWAVRRSGQQLEPRVHLLAILILLLLLLQAFAGAVTVRFDNADWSVALHLSLALLFISAALMQFLFWMRDAGDLPDMLRLQAGSGLAFRRRLSLMTGSLFAVLFIGAWLATSNQGSHAASCSIGWIEGWPLCRGQLLPQFGTDGTDLQMTHRLAVVAVAVLVGWNVHRLRALTDESTQILTRLATGSLALMLLNALVGGAFVMLADADGFPELLSLAHLLLGTLSLMVLVFALLITHIERGADGEEVAAEE